MEIDILNNYEIVYIAECIENYGEISFENLGLEQESKSSTEYILSVLNKLFPKVHYYSNPSDFSNKIAKHKNHLIFPNWFGKGSRCRNAYIQTICETNNLHFIGADAFTRLLSADKLMTKLYVKPFGINVPDAIAIYRNEEEILDKIQHLSPPFIVKPNFEGSSIGICQNNYCSTPKIAAKKAFELSKVFSNSILIEEYIEGIEVKVFVFGNREKIHMIHERVIYVGDNNYFTDQVIDYKAKYSKANLTTKNESILTKMEKEKIANTFKSFTKAEYMRFDYRCNDSGCYLIELSPDCSIRKGSTPHNSFINSNLNYEGMIAAFALNSVDQLNDL